MPPTVGEAVHLDRGSGAPAPVRRRDRAAGSDTAVSATAAVTSPRAPAVATALESAPASRGGLAFLLLLPSLVIFGVFIFYPFFKNFYLGFYRTPPFPGLPKRYVGFDQYSRGARRRASSSTASRRRCAFAFMTVPDRDRARPRPCGRRAPEAEGASAIYRTIFSSTVATSVAVAAVIFGTLFNPRGRAAAVARRRTRRPPILDNPSWALAAVALITVWQTLGLTFILMSSGLQGDPRRAARSRRRSTAPAPGRASGSVTLPLLSPTIFFAVVVGGDLRVPDLRADRPADAGRSAQADQRAHVLHLQHAAHARTTTARPRCSPSRCS